MSHQYNATRMRLRHTEYRYIPRQVSFSTFMCL